MCCPCCCVQPTLNCSATNCRHGWRADRIDARFDRELTAKQDEVDGLKAYNAKLQAKLDGKMVVNGDTSDGYHTFNELYDHRAKLFSVVVSDHKDRCWKSMHHHDGSMYDGMFIVGINTPDGQASYHYDVDPYWDMFDCKELDRAPEWDGHTPEQAIDRIAKLASSSSVILLPLETEEHIPRKAVGYYLADEPTPCVTLDFVSPSIEANRLRHVAPEPPETIEDVLDDAMFNDFSECNGCVANMTRLVDRAYACGKRDGAGEQR